jgi:hypothetical protein
VSTAVAEPVLDMDLEKAIPCEIRAWERQCPEPALYRLIFESIHICPHRIMLACAAHRDWMLAELKRAGPMCFHRPCGYDSRILLIRIEAL